MKNCNTLKDTYCSKCGEINPDITLTTEDGKILCIECYSDNPCVCADGTVDVVTSYRCVCSNTRDW